MCILKTKFLWAYPHIAYPTKHLATMFPVKSGNPVKNKSQQATNKSMHPNMSYDANLTIIMDKLVSHSV